MRIRINPPNLNREPVIIFYLSLAACYPGNNAAAPDLVKLADNWK